ncbi:SMI1/KNR4 family protein [Chitinophaga sancti]|uniref:SMI1/KNR4 family protein n=1 Tax=Chitinophaga sancti TaxID=1004 RepID=UPI003F79F443
MTPYKKQLERIKEKLRKAKNADKHYEVFGASSHEYVLHSPASENEVAAFEAQYGLTLPACYRAFLLEVGNGGDSYNDSGAGPYYGIYKLGEDVEAYVESKYLKNDCLIYPGMTEEYWNSLVARLDPEAEDELSDEEYAAQMGKAFGGILPVGSQGCSSMHGMILNGPYAGKMVNLSEVWCKPIFTFENNFLDWYERWLDEVVTGQLLGNGWFGYYKGGPDLTLILQFLDADDMKEKQDCLDGVQWKKTIATETIEIVENAYFDPSLSAFHEQLLLILTKNAYERARPILLQLAPIRIGKVCQLVHFYAKSHQVEWLSLVSQYIHTVTDKDDFRFCSYILTEECGELLVPFMDREEADIRANAIYTLGKFLDKKRYLDTFIKALYDVDNKVVHASLQALCDVNDTRLLPHYKKVAERYPIETDYILCNLDGRLYPFDLTHETIKDWQPSPAPALQSFLSWLLPVRRGKKA